MQIFCKINTTQISSHYRGNYTACLSKETVFLRLVRCMVYKVLNFNQVPYFIQPCWWMHDKELLMVACRSLHLFSLLNYGQLKYIFGSFPISPRPPQSLKKWIFKLLWFPCWWYSNLCHETLIAHEKELIRSLSTEKMSKTCQNICIFHSIDYCWKQALML